MKLIILQGPPASGKTTWTKDYLKSITPEERKRTVIVSKDAIREITGTYWVPEREDYISTLEDTMIKGALSKKLDVIVDATNLNPKTLNHLAEIGHEFNAEIKKREFYVPFAVALERDKSRERSVGKKVLEGFYQRYFKEQYEKELYIDDRKMEPMHLLLPDCVICDLDGTLAIHTSGRSPYDLSRVEEDTVNKALARTINALSKHARIIFMSGRDDTEECRTMTERWIREKAHIECDFKLIMREANDKRPDNEVKFELYKENIEGEYNVIGIYDDRDKVVKMWRELGLPCYQVYYGNF